MEKLSNLISILGIVSKLLDRKICFVHSLASLWGTKKIPHLSLWGARKVPHLSLRAPQG